MVSGATSDPFVSVASALAAASFGSVIAVSLAILVIRLRAAAARSAHGRFVAVWRPLIFDHLVGGAPALPSVAPRDEGSFLLLWIQLQDGLRAETRSGQRLAQAVGARRMARKRVEKRDALGRILALRTLGYLGDPADYGEVLRHVDEPRTYLCLAAARALVHIDPRRAPHDILQRLAERVDWPVALFSTVLSNGDLADLPAALRRVLARLPAERVVRLLPVVAIFDPGAAEGILRDFLVGERHPDVLCAALKHVATPALLPLVRPAGRHDAWAVRTQAAAALGRVGELADRDLLVSLLHDREWWVRYRAAGALCSGRFGSAEDLRRVAAALDDRFAREIVEQALAEHRP